VVQLGEGVSDLSLGDRVALEPGVSSFTNDVARKGRYNLDPAISFAATPPFHGSLQSFVDHPAAFAFRLPPEVSMEARQDNAAALASSF
jgi:D-xylulose reductase